jgi:hypothetical protein
VFQFAHGVKKILVSAPVKSEGILNVVVGCNDKLYDPAKDHIITAASCTTNCLAPVVKVIKENLVRKCIRKRAVGALSKGVKCIQIDHVVFIFTLYPRIWGIRAWKSRYLGW